MQDRNYNLNPFGQQQSASQQQQRPQQMQQDQQQHRPQQQQPMQQDPQQQQQYGSQTQSYAPQQQQVYGQPQPHLQQQHTQPAFQQQQWQQQPSQQQQQRPAQQYEPQPGYGSTPNSMYNGGTPELGAYGTHPQPPSHLMPTPTPTPPFSSSPYGTAEALPALVASAASPPPLAHGAAVAAAIGVGGGDGPSRVVILVEATLALKPTWADLRGLYLEPLLIAMENQQQLQQQQQQQQQQQVTPEIALIVFRGCSSMPCEGLFESSGWVDSVAEVSRRVERGERHKGVLRCYLPSEVWEGDRYTAGCCDATRPQKCGKGRGTQRGAVMLPPPEGRLSPPSPHILSHIPHFFPALVYIHTSTAIRRSATCWTTWCSAAGRRRTRRWRTRCMKPCTSSPSPRPAARRRRNSNLAEAGAAGVAACLCATACSSPRPMSTTGCGSSGRVRGPEQEEAEETCGRGGRIRPGASRTRWRA